MDQISWCQAARWDWVMYFLDLHEFHKSLSLNSRGKVIIMQHSLKKQALPCDRRHDPVISHPFTVQCAPWTGRSVTIPLLLSIIQWSLSIHRPCKTTMHRFVLSHLLKGLGLHYFPQNEVPRTVWHYDCILHTLENYVMCRLNCCLWLLAKYPFTEKTYLI